MPKKTVLARRIAWELGVLAILLLIVFAPNILQWLSLIAPIVYAPQAAFVFPLQVGSQNYNLTLFVGSSYVSTVSPLYNANIWTPFGTLGSLSSANYELRLGVAPFFIITTPPVTGFTCSDMTVTPSSPVTYNAATTYAFRTRCGDAPTEVILQMTRNGESLPAYQLSAGTVISLGGGYYEVQTKLAAGNYKYFWVIMNSTDTSQTSELDYVVNKAVSTLNLTLDGVSAKDRKSVV
jgi:hypothetical protein